MIPPAEIKELTLVDYFKIIKKRSWLVIACTLITGGFVGYRVSIAPRIYEATAKIYVERKLPKVTGKEQVIYERGGPDFGTQMILLNSDSLAMRVLKKLDLLDKHPFSKARFPARKLKSQVHIQPISNTNVVDVRVRGQDPLTVTAIANTWAAEAIAEDIERRSGVTKKGMEWLKKEIDESFQQLQEAEKRLNEFIQENKIVTLSDSGEKIESSVESLKQQKLQLEKELIGASRTYKGKHTKLIDLKNKLDAVEEKLDEEIKKRYSLQQKSLEYKLLKREVNDYNATYENLRNRLQELDISQELLSSNIQTAQEAQPPGRPISPRPVKDVSRAIMMGLMAGVGLAFLLEYLDSTLKTSEDVEFYIKVPFLGYSPRIPGKKKKIKDIGLFSYEQSASTFAEAFRNLRVSIIFSSAQAKNLKTIAITSSIPKEGKSTVSANLAAAFATSNESTLLIDADMRKGNLNDIFNVEAKKGLSEILAGMCTWQEAITETSIPNLSLISCGSFSPNPIALLKIGKVQELFKEIGQKYNRIIIDTPPVLNVADAVIIGGESQAVVFIIKGESTPLQRVLEAIKTIKDKTTVIGAVLNDIDFKKDQYYYRHYYYYGTSLDKKS